MPATTKSDRFTYIDWLRGFACLLMFQVHAYDSWLSPAARETQFFKWSQLSGTVPAPLFLFLAGVSFALVTDKMRRKGMAANEIARKTILRGAEILALGYGFRLQEYLLGLPWAPWTDGAAVTEQPLQAAGSRQQSDVSRWPARPPRSSTWLG